MTTRKLNVMQIISNLDIGGAQEVVRTLVEYLASDNCMPVVCTFKDGPLRQDIERLGITVEVLPPRRYSIMALPLFIFDMVRIWRSLARFVKKHNVDVVQTHLLRSLDFLVLLLLYTTNLRVVLWTFHSANFELAADYLPKHKWLLAPKRYSHRALYRLASHLVGGFVAISDRVGKAMVEVIGPIGDKITVICNGVDTRRYGPAVDKTLVRSQLGLKANARLIAMVGTLKKVKGHCYMIEAMTSLVPRYPDLHLLFVGDGELREELQAQIARLDLEERIHFLGNRHDVPDLLAGSDVFVLPSLWEGLSMALLEAMASGLPIVASKVSGTVQAIIPNETGLLVPPGDVQRLTEAIEQLLSDPARAQAMGAAARRRVEAEFSAQKQADEHLALYHRLLDEASTSGNGTRR
jgi:glycosyltransferase involved in cell wall biosynthesis